MRIEKLVSGGEGLGRVEGVPIFVPRSAPGDLLRVRLTERKPGYARGEISELIEPGPERREPPCPHYDRCGGCDLQHLEDRAQLRLKAESVVETLRRLAKLDKLPPRFEVLPGQPWGYRTRAQLQVGDSDRGRQVGYFARGSRDLVAIERCPILVPELETELPALPRKLRESGHSRLDISAGDGGRWTSSPPHEGLPRGEIRTQVGDFTFTYDARCFFQAHRQLTPVLVERAVSGFADPAGEVYELFSGVGLFSLALARNYRRVVAVEGDRLAVRFARKNARLNGLGNVQTLAQSVESWIERLPKGVARVLVDPPRTGLSPKICRFLLGRRPRRLTYVSCQPATLARDLVQLRRVYSIESLTLLDMFPQTGHMEVVVQMRLPDEGQQVGIREERT
ncbi:MAG: class I SAM-dependent RNA methyltransferase [Holophagales bacterium]|nr:class I SAM-dependent RNA methyltransferase [Holophagales bacterium]